MPPTPRMPRLAASRRILRRTIRLRLTFLDFSRISIGHPAWLDSADLMALWMAMGKRQWPYDHLDDPAEETFRLGDIPPRRTLPQSATDHDKQTRSNVQEVEPVLDPAFNINPSSTSTNPDFTWQSGPVDKLLLLCASILPLLASTYLLVRTVTDSRSTGSLLDFVSNDRATAQIVVSVVSALLAGLNVYTMTKLLNFATRIHLLRRSLTLTMVKFIGAVVTSRLVSGVPATMFTTSVIALLLFALPNVLWTGALTPILTNSTILETGLLKIPQYSPSSNATWSDSIRLYHTECTTVTNRKGVFSDCPVDVLHSSLLSRAAQASSNLTQIHSKTDNSHYAYVGRSYGVGSPAGLVDENLSGGRSSPFLLSYNYTETGYLTTVTCFHNASSDWHLQEIQAGNTTYGTPYIYYATGYFPNAPPGSGIDFFSVVGLNGDDNIAVLASKRSEGRNVIAIAAGSDYSVLNGTQCEVMLEPNLFAVGVDVANKLIYVHPITITTAVHPLFDPTAGLAGTVIGQLNSLGMISTSLYTSIVGDSLMTNIIAASASANSPPFAAMADSFAAMLDDLLLFVGSSQFFVPAAGAGDFTTVDVHLTVRAVRLGDAGYVLATFAMCVALLVAVGAEAFRTGAWRWLPKWDFTDTTCLVRASAVAGDDVVAGMWRRRRGGAKGFVEWTGGGGWEEEEEEEGSETLAPGWRGTNRLPAVVRLRLGRKVVKVPPLQAHDVDANAAATDEMRISAVSLWTSGATGVVPLV